MGTEPGKGIAKALGDSSELCQHAARPGNQCKFHFGKTSMKGTDYKEKDPGGPTLEGGVNLGLRSNEQNQKCPGNTFKELGNRLRKKEGRAR